MTHQQSSPRDAEGEILEGHSLIRRFTDELEGSNQLEISTQVAQATLDEESREKENIRLRELFEGSVDEDARHKDFKVSRIARDELQKMVDGFVADEKTSMFHRISRTGKSAKSEATEVFQNLLKSSTEDVKASVDQIAQNWEAKNGRVYQALKTLCRSIDGHKAVFCLFPSDQMYMSVFSSSVLCLVNAVNTHSEIADLLSTSISRISDKVIRCSKLLRVFNTRSISQKLAEIYAIMFRYYHKAIQWYLQSKGSRSFFTFNENIKKGFESARDDLEDDIRELYHEAEIGNHAMVAMLLGDVERLSAEVRQQRAQYSQNDTTAGHRMLNLMEATWSENLFLRWSTEMEAARNHRASIEHPSEPIQQMIDSHVSLSHARSYINSIEKYVIGDEGSSQFVTGRSWASETQVLPKLREWMVESAAPNLLWISSPYERSGVTSAQASALMVVSSAWQAKAPIVSHFCQRPQRVHLRANMSLEQVGLIGLVYSLISQLLQFSHDNDMLPINEEALVALDGREESWIANLELLGALLDATPALSFCVIDGLNELEWGQGHQWCRQFLNVVLAHQRKGTVKFNLLLTTSGQSRVLGSVIDTRNRHFAKETVRNLAHQGKGIRQL